MTPAFHPDAWYEAPEVARALKVSRKTLSRAGIPNARMSARRALYLGRDITAWLEAKRDGR